MNFSKEGGIESGSLEADADLLLLLVEGLGGHDHDVGLLLDGVSLVAVDGVGAVGGDVADAVGGDVGEAASDDAVLVLGLAAGVVVGGLVVGDVQAEGVGVGGVQRLLNELHPLLQLRGAHGHAHKTYENHGLHGVEERERERE